MKNETSLTKITFGVACGILLAPLLLIAGCVACVAGVAVMDLIPIQDERPGDAALQLRDVTTEPKADRSGMRVVGTLHNVGNRPRRSVAIRIDWLDEHGNPVEQTAHRLVQPAYPLESRETRPFEISSPASPRITDARLALLAESF